MLKKSEPLNQWVRLRITKDQLIKLQGLADELKTTRSDVIRELIDVAVHTGQPRLLIGAQKDRRENAS